MARDDDAMVGDGPTIGAERSICTYLQYMQNVQKKEW